MWELSSFYWSGGLVLGGKIFFISASCLLAAGALDWGDCSPVFVNNDATANHLTLDFHVKIC